MNVGCAVVPTPALSGLSPQGFTPCPLHAHGVPACPMQVVVAGDQSSGKSTVLSRLVGAELPRDTGVCTKATTEVRMLPGGGPPDGAQGGDGWEYCVCSECGPPFLCARCGHGAPSLPGSACDEWKA